MASTQSSTFPISQLSARILEQFRNHYGRDKDREEWFSLGENHEKA